MSIQEPRCAAPRAGSCNAAGYWRKHAIRGVVACALIGALITGCRGVRHSSHSEWDGVPPTVPTGVDLAGLSPQSDEREALPALDVGSQLSDFVRYALLNNPAVEAAYQRWRAVAETGAQVGALPDPQLTLGVFLEEVETRVGPQEARFGVRQAFPWPGVLSDRERAADAAARAAFRQFEAARLDVVEQTVRALHDLRYLEVATAITRENLELLRSFEEVVRARYRVGTGSHPELIRVQVELGEVEDRVAELEAVRPTYVAFLNAALNRESEAPVAQVPELPATVVAKSAAELVQLIDGTNPSLLALDEEIERQRTLADVARQEGYPSFSLGLDYISTGDARMSGVSGSGDDPVLLSLGVSLPIWRGRYDAAVREALARRLAVTQQRNATSNQLASSVHRAWFEHTDAHRRVRLYGTLIPKAEESLRASLAGFRAGDASFLDLLDTQRKLLEFALAAERSRADRGQALARLTSLVGAPLDVVSASDQTGEEDGD